MSSRRRKQPSTTHHFLDDGQAQPSPASPRLQQKIKSSTGKRKKAQANGGNESKGLVSLKASLQQAGNEARRVQRAYLAEAEKKKVEMSATEVQTMMTKVVRYVLFKQHQHPHVPIQRKEIIGVINAGSRHRVAAYILALAQAHVAGIFGIHMQEITRKTKAGPFDIHAVGNASSFVLTSMLPNDARQQLLPPPTNPPQHALLLTVLALIHLNLGRLTEQELWRHLQELGLSPGSTRHPQLGVVKEALATMIKQRYVFEGKSNSQEGEIRFYEWGEQALAQMSTEEIDTWVHELCGVTKMVSSQPTRQVVVKAE